MKKTILSRAIAAVLIAAPVSSFAAEADLLKKIEQLANELQSLKAELQATKTKTETVEKKQEALASTDSPFVLKKDATLVGASGAQTTIGGYGEINYNRPTKNTSQAQTDVRRAVISMQHRFDEKTKLVTEFEWEHAIASSSDQGEAAIEQLYVEREFNSGLRAKAGLFLMPIGLLNDNHEPTNFYGVERNFVETAIIPSTWREAGFGLSGNHENGLSWDAGIVTGFDLTKWDAASTEGIESPLGAIHQEGQLAKSRNLSLYGALNWRGVPGLLLGGSAFVGKVGHDTPGFLAPDSRMSLWDLHARYTPGKWDLSALYTRGTISNTDALNMTLVGNPSLVPSSFYGWYTQAAYQVWKSADYKLTPFVRYERFNTAKSYSDLPQGLGVVTGPTEGVVTVGANLKVGEGIVLKADYQKFKEDSTRDRFNLGVGYAF